MGHSFIENLNLTKGANNLFDTYPDRADLDLESGVEGDQNNRSSGRFNWSHRAQQFGIGGRFLFAV